MKPLRWMGGALAALACFPLTAYAYETPIEEGMVEVQEIVDYFDGRFALSSTDEGKRYMEFIFDGHVIRIYENETILWLDGEPKPVNVSESNGILLPKTGKKNMLSRDMSLPAEFFSQFFEYEVNGDKLVFAEKPKEKKEALTEADLPELPKEKMPEFAQEDVPLNSENNEEIQKEDNVPAPFPDADSPEPPTKEKKVKESPEQNKKESDKKQVPKDTNEKEKKSEDRNKETPKPTPPAEEELQKETPAPTPDKEEKEPKEAGKGSITIDKGDAWLHSNASNGLSTQVEGQQFSVYFISENKVGIIWEETGQEKQFDTYKGSIQTVRFDAEDGDYYSIQIEVLDTRNAGLSLTRVRQYIANIDPSIVIDPEGDNVHIHYTHNDANKRARVFSKTEEALVSLGVRRFRLDREQTLRWDIWFNLHDSTWGV